MRRLIPRFALLACLLCGTAIAQTRLASLAERMALPILLPSAMPAAAVPSSDYEPPVLPAPVALPRMAPELALRAYEQKSQLQSAALTAYSSTTVVRASLPSTSQSGEFELQRNYSAPHNLTFKAIKFIGDSFVKTNIIARLLQSEVDHIQKDDLTRTALSPANYKFYSKGTSEIEGRVVHVYQVKPRKKRVGLFKGRIFLDAYTGSLVRAEGTAVKSPSLFIKKIEFVQDYVDVGAFTFPAHIHSEAQTRLVGRAVVDIYQSDYQPVSISPLASQIPSL